MVTSRARVWVLTWAALGACGGTFEARDGSGGAAAVGAEAGNAARPSGSEPNASGGRTSGSAGSGSSSAPGSGGSSAGSGDMLPPSSGGSAYSGHGFVVHEWGTDTIVVGSDGSLQRGLHHEEEDLPAFVYDRVKAATLLGQSSPSVTIKMETPVTYFYSDVPLTVQASVGFPQGVLTQWYPGVTVFTPPLAGPSAINQDNPLTLADPALDPNFSFMTDMCRAKFSALAGGTLDWGKISVLARGTEVSARLPVAPLEKFGWSYARAVASNPLQTPSGETERFLFYRGLGDFELPVTVQAEAGGKVALVNHFTEAIGSVFMIHVDAERGAFTAHPKGIAPGATLAGTLPNLDGAQPLAAYANELGAAVTATLDATGLYHDEATAMVNTWKRQWFRTPGSRLLYVIPQRWTDASIPLTIAPKPETTLRVMLIRVELITPEQEGEDVVAVQSFDAAASAARAHFAGLGRFAEPRLRRALALAPSSAASAYLTEIRSANSDVASGE